VVTTLITPTLRQWRRVAARRVATPATATLSHGAWRIPPRRAPLSPPLSLSLSWRHNTGDGTPGVISAFDAAARALAEPKDDRSASEIARDNSLPCGFLSSISLCLALLRFPPLLASTLSLCFSFRPQRKHNR